MNRSRPTISYPGESSQERLRGWLQHAPIPPKLSRTSKEDMSLIRLENITKTFDNLHILRDVYLRLSRGDRLGLIGGNGSGKTTVLKLILGQEEPDGGTVGVDQGLKIGYFSQFSELSGSESVLDVLEGLFHEVHKAKADLRATEQAMAHHAEDRELERLVKEQAAILERMEHLDGWNYQYRIETVLSRLGFSDDHRLRPIDHLSGGWRNRAALAEILLEDPDVLLMDEPTNFLDIEGQAWLEAWFQSFRGGLIVVSHDRHFLDSVVTRLVEIENYRFQEYVGDYTNYVREKRLRLKTLERQFEHEEELLALESEAISSRAEARKNPSKALIRKLSDVRKRSVPRLVDQIVSSLYTGIHVSNNLLTVAHLEKHFDEQSVVSDLSFNLLRGDRLAIIGPNGCGKSTLIRCLVEEGVAGGGDISWVRGTKFAYFNGVVDRLDPKDAVSHAVNVTGLAYDAPRKIVNRFLQLLRFSDADLNQRIGTLSGGQRARVALAKCLLSGASVIIMDEPTNHLDIKSVQVIERALIHFPGAIIVVSHDRFFIDNVATRLLVFAGEGRIDEIHGAWTTWQTSLQNEA
jgi:ATPase subunit of ABC transporter with duplicated ATPase domains